MMAGEPITAADVGTYWLGADGNVWRLISHCEYPTVCWARVDNPDIHLGGAIGSPNAQEFQRLKVSDE